MPQRKMVHDIDPAQEIRNRIGNLKDFSILGNWLLLGIYVRPKVTASGIHLPDQTRDEDIHQGKAALVLMRGESAFVSDAQRDFRGEEAKIGEWVCVHVTEGRKLVINGQICRLCRDEDVIMKISSPDAIY
jgi:co-chaperonin GroES (HSP10)